MSLHRRLLVVELAFQYLRHRTRPFFLLATPVWLAILGIAVCSTAVVVTCALQEGVRIQVEEKFRSIMDNQNGDGAPWFAIHRGRWTVAQIHAFDAAVRQDGRLRRMFSSPVFNGMAMGPSFEGGLDSTDGRMMVFVGGSLLEDSEYSGLRELAAREAKVYRSADSPGRVWVPRGWLEDGTARIGGPLLIWSGRLRISPAGVSPRMKKLEVAGALPPAVAGLARDPMWGVVIGDDAALSAALALDQPSGTISVLPADFSSRANKVYYRSVSGSLLAHGEVKAMMESSGISSEVADASFDTSVFERQRWLSSLAANQDTWRKQLGTEELVADVILVLLLSAAAANCMGVLQLLVQARRRDIAVLRSMGLSSRAAACVFALMACSIGVGGLVLGNILGIILSHHLSDILSVAASHTHFDKSLLPLPVVFPWARLALVALSGVGLCVLLGLVPAHRAATILPARVFAEED